MAYDNARLPQALIAAGHRLGDPALLETGLEALDWYAAQCELDSPGRAARRQPLAPARHAHRPPRRARRATSSRWRPPRWSRP